MTMRGTSLELTYRRGKLFAGYLHLPRDEGDEVVRSKKVAEGLVVDYAEGDRPVGIEIVSPSIVSPDAIYALLKQMHCEQVSKEELAPLIAG